jgi:hypothetical protein
MTDISEVPEDVRAQFLELARLLRSRGFQHHSADAVLHRIRWLGSVEKGDREYKCNNNWTAPLARWAMAADPSLSGLFNLRERSGA